MPSPEPSAEAIKWRVVQSPLSGRFYACRCKPEGSHFKAIGKKHDVTDCVDAFIAQGFRAGAEDARKQSRG